MKNLIKLSIILLAVTISFPSQAQKKKTVIMGYVKDSLMRPIANAAIFVDNIKQDEKTNSKGFYRLKLKKSPKKIMFLSFDYGVEERIYTGNGSINIVYGKKALNVNDKSETVVITTKTTKRKNNIEYKNIYDYLSGRVAGLKITSDNKIQIRGVTSFNSSLEPLFILNDMATSNFDDISPSDIKSVSVLKGPEAALYGSRGANGVIIITTY